MFRVLGWVAIWGSFGGVEEADLCEEARVCGEWERGGLGGKKKEFGVIQSGGRRRLWESSST